MKKTAIKIFKILIFAVLVVAFLKLSIIFGGKAVNGMTPKGGINESLYVDINGSKQWINIYGQSKDNPVLLYLHGGPGSSTSMYDYKFLRPLSDIYTVVTWDQRGCGNSYTKEHENDKLSYEILMKDGVEMTEFLRSYLHKDKITLLGHSWGTLFGTGLAQMHPEYYECYIGAGQVVDMFENEEAFAEEARNWVKGDPEGEELLAIMETAHFGNGDYFNAREMLMQRYGYSMLNDEWEYNSYRAVVFSPNSSVADLYKYLKKGQTVYPNYIELSASEEFWIEASIKDKTEYKIPFYNINGDKDFQTNHILAEEYFNKVKAPRKKLYTMKNMRHSLLEAQPTKFSEIVHEIAAIERAK